VKIELETDEAEALLMLIHMLKTANPPVPEFLNWIAERLVNHSGDDPNMDFVQALKRCSIKLAAISALLKV